MVMKTHKKNLSPGKRAGRGSGRRTAENRRTAGAGRANRDGEGIEQRTVRGILRKTRRGFGFVTPDDGNGGDVYISVRNINGAMHGDRVDAAVYVSDRRAGLYEGRVKSVVERNTEEVVGTFARNRRFGFVVPDDRNIGENIFISRNDFAQAERGDKVLVKLIKYPDGHNAAEGLVLEVIGKAGEAGSDLKALARGFGVTERFPSKVSAEAEALRKHVTDDDIRPDRTGKTPGQRPPRRDLRGHTIFTIDGADSKDFDDAVSIDKLNNGHYLLGVHIADVSHYVKENAPLDEEALKRGTSIYLPGMVIPMLPAALSNGICSLNENVDRLTLSIDMEVDENGAVIRHALYESVIRSVARLVYDDVSDLLENNDAFQMKRYRHIASELKMMGELARILENARRRRGSIDFDLDEAIIHMDPDGLPTGVTTRERRAANRMIEEFMVLANETVAKAFCLARLPFVYRVHERPDAEKMREFMKFIAGFGLKPKGNPAKVKPLALSELLRSVEGSPCERIISKVCLRSMQKAVYGVECLGHFGLALKYYCHFTSPIRRYPDLMIHRIIKESLGGKLPAKRLRSLKTAVAEVAARASATEQRAVMLEREVEKRLKTEYISRYIGREYDAVISGVTSFGLFAELENTVEGMIGLNTLDDDYYDYEAEHYRIVGRTN
ncbi:MAG: ribonuclease R, partial [Clostridiales Family XIII bacterium]|nr:ribonuclease R [Clostridiales Family XIII bacterium]